MKVLRWRLLKSKPPDTLAARLVIVYTMLLKGTVPLRTIDRNRHFCPRPPWAFFIPAQLIRGNWSSLG